MVSALFMRVTSCSGQPLTIYRYGRTTRSTEHGDSASSIDGHIDITGIQEAVVLAGPGMLTLTIEDGRRMAFQLTSSSGAISGRGWLP